jgi:hypothetical protein
MFTNWLLSRFLKDDINYKDPGTRRSVGYLAGIVGVVVNILVTII